MTMALLLVWLHELGYPSYDWSFKDPFFAVVHVNIISRYHKLGQDSIPVLENPILLSGELCKKMGLWLVL